MGKSQPCLKALAILEDKLEVNILEVLQSQGIVFNQTGNSFKDQSTGIVHGFPKSLQEQYELRLKEKEETIQFLKSQIEVLQKLVG